MIPVKEYTDASTHGNMVSSNIDISKYIDAFQAINSRVDHSDEKFKYERCCLLIVDFDRAIPKIYNTSAELIMDGYLPYGSNISMVGLDYQNFIADILNIYRARFPANTFI